MELNRKPTIQELKLLEKLVAQSEILFHENWKDSLIVRPMDDGGMGSLLLIPRGLENVKRKMGRQVSDFQFADKDGVLVIASLNVDEQGELFELDIWKTNYDKIIRFPEFE